MNTRTKSFQDAWDLFPKMACAKMCEQAAREAIALESEHRARNLPVRMQQSITRPEVAVVERIQPAINHSIILKELAFDTLSKICQFYSFEVLGNFISDKLILKPPGCPGYSLHKDSDYWEEKPGFHTGSIAIFLNDSPVDSGPIMLPEKNSEENAFMPINGHIGDVLFFGGGVQHWSSPNISENYRRTLYLSFHMKT